MAFRHIPLRAANPAPGHPLNDCPGRYRRCAWSACHFGLDPPGATAFTRTPRPPIPRPASRSTDESCFEAL